MHTMTRLFTALALALALAACGKPTVEGADARYKTNRDKISAVMAKKPETKATLEAKLAEFATEYEAAMKEGSDEKKIEKLSALNSRMDKFLAEVDPKPAEDKKDAPKGGEAAPSNKLDGAPAADGAAPAPAPAPSKLDANPASGAAAPAPAPAPAPTPAPAPAPAGGGMGGL